MILRQYLKPLDAMLTCTHCVNVRSQK